MSYWHSVAVVAGVVAFLPVTCESSPVAAAAGDYIKVAVKGKLTFEQGRGYFIEVRLQEDPPRTCKLSLVIPEDKVLVRKLERFTGKAVIVSGYLDRPGEGGTAGQTALEYGRIYIKLCEVRPADAE
jgi:hypothetical protein